MTNRSDCELQKWIQEHPAPDYTSEVVQKRLVIGTDHGVAITLYDWIHRFDTVGVLLDSGWMDEYTSSWVKEFHKALSEELNK